MFKFNGNSNRGAGFIVLNIIRVLNIIALLTVVAASWVMLVKPAKNSQFYFFDAVSHFITSTIAIFLVVSEVSLFKGWFAKYFPLLGLDFGFIPLAVSMVVLGFNILGNLNKPATSVEKLGLPLWRIVIAGGILTSVMGFVNAVATLVFCDRKAGITGRQVRSHGAASTKEATSDKQSSGSLSSGSVRRPRSSELPSYNTSVPEERRKSRFGLKFPIRMSGISRPVPNDPEQFSKWESRSSPVVPDVQRPPTALHPAFMVRTNAGPYPASSRYSVASNVTRF